MIAYKKANLFIFAGAVTIAALAQQAATRAVAEIEPMLVKVAAYEYGQSRETLAQLARYIEESLGNPALLKQIEGRLLKFLQSNATTAAKREALRELSLIATDASLPLLTGMLTQAEMAEMARYALARIPGPASDEVLRKTLGRASGSMKIGIINSLGERRDTKSVPLIRPLLYSDSGVAEAAAAALGKIADRTAMEALASARGKLTGVARLRVSEAYLHSANQFARRGDKRTALGVYKQLAAAQEPELIRIAALGGLAANDTSNAVSTLAGALDSDNRAVQSAAIRLLAGIPGPEAISALVRRFPKLEASSQVLLLKALATRGDSSALPLMTTAAKSGAADVRAAALLGLGRIGGGSSMMLLAEAASASEGNAQTAARDGLLQLRDQGIDQSIISAIGATSGKVKAELILAAGERGITSAADILVKALQDSDLDVRRAAVRALGNVAGSPQVPVLLDLVLRASSASDRRDAVQTLAAALKTSETERAAVVVSAYNATTELDPRLALLEVMGRTSIEDALGVLRGNLKDSNPEITRASVLALSEWTNPAPLPDLLAVARRDAGSTLQVLALRGYLRLLALPSQRSRAVSASMVGEAMRLAKQPAEKRLALSLLPPFASKEALQVAQAAQADQAVAQEAKAAVDSINSRSFQ